MIPTFYDTLSPPKMMLTYNIQGITEITSRGANRGAAWAPAAPRLATTRHHNSWLRHGWPHGAIGPWQSPRWRKSGDPFRLYVLRIFSGKWLDPEQKKTDPIYDLQLVYMLINCINLGISF